MNKKFLILITTFVFIVIILFTFIKINHRKNYETMSYSNFIERVEQKNVRKVIIKNDEELEVSLDNGLIYIVSNPLKDDFKEYLLLKDIEVIYKSNTDLERVFSSIFIICIVLGIIIYRRRENKEKGHLIKDYNKKSSVHNNSLIKFEDVAGNYEAKEMLKDIIDFIKVPDKYKEIGAKMPRGVLFYGVPGTGKTLLAKAIAGEANVPFYAMSGSDFVQMYVGVGANRVRGLFKEARKSEKAVIFIDEIDALGKSRSGNTNSANDEREQTLNALLTEMSGFNNSEGIVVIGATNRVDTLDPALLRPGRFDRHIEVSLPDQKAREEIITLYLKDKPVADNVDIKQLSKQTIMFSGAMLEHLINEAAILAANKESLVINKNHVEEAFYTVVAGMEKKNYELLTEYEEKLITAYHEAGHGLIARLLLPEIEIAKITIIPTIKGVAGYNYNISKDRMYKRKKEIIANIKVLLGGRAAEEIIFGEENVTTGAMNDIKQASKELYYYFSKYGMDDESSLFYIEDNTINQKLYERCREKMKGLYSETKELLLKNSDKLEKLAKLLIQKESINGHDIDTIIS